MVESLAPGGHHAPDDEPRGDRGVPRRRASQGHLLTGPVLDFPDAVSAVTGMSASQTSERISAVSGVRTPAGWWAYAYDAATLLLKALEDTSLIDVDGTLVISRSELRDTLGRTTFGGLTGQVVCGPLGDCAPRRIAIRAHDDVDRCVRRPPDRGRTRRLRRSGPCRALLRPLPRPAAPSPPRAASLLC